MIKWIFFDIGSTLVDEEECHMRRFDDVEAEMTEKFGRRLSYESEIRPLIIEGGAKREASPAKYACEKLGITFPRYNREYERPYSDSIKTLKALKGRYKLGVIANQPKDLETLLIEMGFDGIFDSVFGSDDVGMKKPDEKIFLYALKKTNCAPREAVIVGDRFDNDIIPAKSVGMKTVRVRTGFFENDRPRDKSERADAEIASVGEIIEAIERIRMGKSK